MLFSTKIQKLFSFSQIRETLQEMTSERHNAMFLENTGEFSVHYSKPPPTWKNF